MERPYIGRCVLVAGSPAAGIVLYRLNFWKPTREINGRLWVAKSRAELMYETGLSEQQVKDALAKLRKDGLIQTSQHLFHGKNVMHVLITAKGSEVLKDPTGVVSNDPAQVVSGEPAQAVSTDATSYTSYMQGESQGEHTGSSEQTLASAPSEPMKETDKVNPESKPKSVKDVILGQSARKVLHKPDSAKSLEFLWKSLVSEVTGGYVSVTQKQLGQLKHFMGKCPPGTSQDVLEFAVRNWIDFVKEAEVMAGLKSTPASPNLDFLLKHADVAVTLRAAAKAVPPTPKQEATKGVPCPQPLQLIAQADETEEAPKTLEELMSIIGNG